MADRVRRSTATQTSLTRVLRRGCYDVSARARAMKRSSISTMRTLNPVARTSQCTGARLAPMSVGVLEPGVPVGVDVTVIRVQMDEAAVDLEVPDLEDVAPPPGVGNISAPLHPVRGHTVRRALDNDHVAFGDDRELLVVVAHAAISVATSPTMRAISVLPRPIPHFGNRAVASSANRSRTSPPLSSRPKYCRAIDTRCSRVMVREATVIASSFRRIAGCREMGGRRPGGARL